MTAPGQISDPLAAQAFILAGNARFTLESLETNRRYTYRASLSDDKRLAFVSLLTGPDNEGDYSYLGIIPTGLKAFRLTAKSKMNLESGPVKALSWALTNFERGTMPIKLRFFHEGRCCRCGRALTVPASIESGWGPECVKRRAA